MREQWLPVCKKTDGMAGRREEDIPHLPPSPWRHSRCQERCVHTKRGLTSPPSSLQGDAAHCRGLIEEGDAFSSPPIIR